jgi:hypothetical protein
MSTNRGNSTGFLLVNQQIQGISMKSKIMLKMECNQTSVSFTHSNLMFSNKPKYVEWFNWPENYSEVMKYQTILVDIRKL